MKKIIDLSLLVEEGVLIPFPPEKTSLIRKKW